MEDRDYNEKNQDEEDNPVIDGILRIYYKMIGKGKYHPKQKLNLNKQTKDNGLGKKTNSD